eukprot:TRINITY_DN851_c0_g1_i1.p1 TRINITY_DN851_c0_g1~~TRINITY_DN851_c0_g1_i1.p1  ORF type:complete len:704 (-),score=165.01 TRINITY_DN851_c0_g1_i1:96-2168(-)
MASSGGSSGCTTDASNVRGVSRKVTVTGAHPHELKRTDKKTYLKVIQACCDLCSRMIGNDEESWRCSMCMYDLCNTCVVLFMGFEPKTLCSSIHPEHSLQLNVLMKQVCQTDNCAKCHVAISLPCWQCNRCDVNFCLECARSTDLALPTHDQVSIRRIPYDDGSMYYGQVMWNPESKEFVRHGYGAMFLKFGRVHAGSYRFGIWDGPGVFQWETGEYIIGNIAQCRGPRIVGFGKRVSKDFARTGLMMTDDRDFYMGLIIAEDLKQEKWAGWEFNHNEFFGVMSLDEDFSFDGSCVLRDGKWVWKDKGIRRSQKYREIANWNADKKKESKDKWSCSLASKRARNVEALARHYAAQAEKMVKLCGSKLSFVTPAAMYFLQSQKRINSYEFLMICEAPCLSMKDVFLLGVLLLDLQSIAPARKRFREIVVNVAGQETFFSGSEQVALFSGIIEAVVGIGILEASEIKGLLKDTSKKIKKLRFSESADCEPRVVDDLANSLELHARQLLASEGTFVPILQVAGALLQMAGFKLLSGEHSIEAILAHEDEILDLKSVYDVVSYVFCKVNGLADVTEMGTEFSVDDYSSHFSCEEEEAKQTSAMSNNFSLSNNNQVRFWTVEDVRDWISSFGGSEYSACAKMFAVEQVDGPALLRLATSSSSEAQLASILQKRFEMKDSEMISKLVGEIRNIVSK